MFKLVRIDGLTCVALYCDQCRRKISDARMALYVWNPALVTKCDEDGATICPPGGDFAVLHKGQCDRSYERAKGGYLHWDEMSMFLVYMATNMGLDGEAVLKHLDIYGERKTKAEAVGATEGE